ncbi:Hsp20/alpha crystallin family protein [Citricoccus sp. SGAir0253]|uniref:Hsp20/alpha crystallin family protein n=1 Tax=Citricoccus sp. SGAir0253 TaxID=2567881 RepID=UPI0010CCE116|nr:Hsp20/alpha crystallin family protein [Citricoccus sp. SGAir0253]QCU77188.1 Hsp20/alpha crystallin family protein [Citricoccus sp. SGAir0253]
MSDLLRWNPFERRTPFDLAVPFRRLLEGDLDQSMIRVEEEVKDGKLCIRAELPGVDPDKDVDISVSDNTVTIRAERRQEERTEDQEGFRSEFRYGSFYRTLPLPANAQADDIQASYRDGVLEITVPVPEPGPGDEGRRKVPISRG